MNETRSTVESRPALTLSQAAAMLGISEKTARKRIAAGEIEGEKIALDGGGVAWRVYLDGASVPEAERNFTVPRAGSEPEHTHSQNERNRSGMVSAVVSEPEVTGTRAGSVMVNASEVLQAESTVEFLAHLKSENAFLRAALEARDRDAAELRAALRSALNAMPKQLEAGSTVEFDRTQGATIKPPEAATNGQQSQARREPRPLWKLLLGIR